MKIAICGSLSFSKEILEIQEKLTEMGHVALLPQSILKFSINNSDDADAFKNKESYLEIKGQYMRDHFKKIDESDAILVVNIDKRGIKNYVGGNTFAEIMVAFHLRKKIFFLNQIPDDEKLSIILEELQGVGPTILNGDLDLIDKKEEEREEEVEKELEKELEEEE